MPGYLNTSLQQTPKMQKKFTNEFVLKTNMAKSCKKSISSEEDASSLPQPCFIQDKNICKKNYWPELSAPKNHRFCGDEGNVFLLHLLDFLMVPSIGYDHSCH